MPLKICSAVSDRLRLRLQMKSSFCMFDPRCGRRQRSGEAAEGTCAGLLDGVGVDQVLVAQIEAAVGDDGMGPDRALGIPNGGLWIQLEAAMFLPAFR